MRVDLRRAAEPALIAVAGALYPLGFAPYNYVLVTLCVLAVLFRAWSKARPGHAALLGYSFGCLAFFRGVNWVSVSMHDHGNAPAWLAQLLTALLAAFLALYPALAGWAVAKLSRPATTARLLLAAPAWWILTEWLRGRVLTGFPWLELGYSQIDTPLAGFAALLGSYGVGWLAAIGAGGLALLSDLERRQRIVLVVVMGSVAGIGWALRAVQWSRPSGAPLQAALVQGNIPMAMKWRPEFRPKTLEIFAEATRANLDADLIVWPEESVSYAFQSIEPTFLAELGSLARDHRTAIIGGFAWYDSEAQHYYNAMASFGEGSGNYFKRHLVPFGEFIPVKPVFGFMAQLLNMAIGEFQRGSAEQPPMMALGYQVAGSICYEDAFGRDTRFALPDAAWVVNVTNEAWFNAVELHQHLQMARMRARETSRYLLRAGTTGLTAIISASGAVVAQAPPFERTVLRGAFVPMQGVSPYVVWGNWPILALLLLAIFAGWRYPVPICVRNWSRAPQR